MRPRRGLTALAGARARAAQRRRAAAQALFRLLLLGLVVPSLLGAVAQVELPAPQAVTVSHLLVVAGVVVGAVSAARAWRR